MWLASLAVVVCWTVAVGCNSSSVPSASPDASASGGTGDCTPKLCPNDAPPPQADIDACNKEMSDPKCGATYAEAQKCTSANRVCGTDGKYDSVKTFATCSAQTKAYATCAASDGGSFDAQGAVTASCSYDVASVEVAGTVCDESSGAGDFAAEKKTCSGVGGKWLDAPCTTANRVGGCRAQIGANTDTEWYYTTDKCGASQTPCTTADIETLCPKLFQTFVTP